MLLFSFITINKELEIFKWNMIINFISANKNKQTHAYNTLEVNSIKLRHYAKYVCINHTG